MFVFLHQCRVCMNDPQKQLPVRISCRWKSHRSHGINDFPFNHLSRDNEPKTSSQQPQMFSHRASWVSGEIMINLLKC